MAMAQRIQDKVLKCSEVLICSCACAPQQLLEGHRMVQKILSQTHIILEILQDPPSRVFLQKVEDAAARLESKRRKVQELGKNMSISKKRKDRPDRGMSAAKVKLPPTLGVKSSAIVEKKLAEEDFCVLREQDVGLVLQGCHWLREYGTTISSGFPIWTEGSVSECQDVFLDGNKEGGAFALEKFGSLHELLAPDDYETASVAKFVLSIFDVFMDDFVHCLLDKVDQNDRTQNCTSYKQTYCNSIYLPCSSVEDELVWDHSKDGQFSVKSAYWLKFYGKFGTGTPVLFSEWLTGWLKSAPNEEVVRGFCVIAFGVHGMMRYLIQNGMVWMLHLTRFAGGAVALILCAVLLIQIAGCYSNSRGCFVFQRQGVDTNMIQVSSCDGWCMAGSFFETGGCLGEIRCRRIRAQV
ncbi:hypothetical protein RHMOL_Rhmol05G0244300 [Rhododendron molle]|uniref:Uncharacterized protein n=1 Tax=Rhododendron molle TaxID=49168 RepID=A0ACC0NTT6_RHOML|nr:hypothetical protein RHMOL_Rhmol05G0244300 [Rhododendron molle]